MARTAKTAKKTKKKDASSEVSILERCDPQRGEMLQVLDSGGKIVNESEFPDIQPERVVEAYKLMILSRVADEKALSWQRQGRIYTFPPNKGQEAAAIGSAYALEKGDWMVPAFRELGAWLHQGVPLSSFYTFFGGNEKGMALPAETRMLPSAVPISSQVPHAVGIGYSIKYHGGKETVITYFGDGGTSQGDFAEGLNFAGVWKVPVIFFCNNNQYAISVPRSIQTSSATLAQKAVAFGFPGIQVDGNDFFAVYAATKAAADRARAGEGPTLIEAVTYRLEAHTTSDDPSRYRTTDEEEEWAAKDPLKRLRGYLESKGLWDEDQEKAEYESAARAAEEAFAEYEAITDYPVEDVFRYQFAETPPELVLQKAAYEKYLNWKETH
jgi:pyruvate dehydrogenase E1 component alpha subunit